jgi:hypothetical protein
MYVRLEVVEKEAGGVKLLRKLSEFVVVTGINVVTTDGDIQWRPREHLQGTTPVYLSTIPSWLVMNHFLLIHVGIWFRTESQLRTALGCTLRTTAAHFEVVRIQHMNRQLFTRAYVKQL